jgi:DNA-binding transcriptional ArsR family regulator
VQVIRWLEPAGRDRLMTMSQGVGVTLHARPAEASAARISDRRLQQAKQENVQLHPMDNRTALHLYIRACNVRAMPHPSEHHDADDPLGRGESEVLAEAMRTFGTASRLRLLWTMMAGERTVEELAAAAGLVPSAASHQLRLLRHARLVTVRREGRHAYYRLHDHHLVDLLAAIRHHYEHVHPLEPVRLTEDEERRTPATP